MSSPSVRWLFGLVAFAIAAGTAAIVGVGCAGTNARAPAIGAITGLTGSEASFGVPWSQGVKLAASQLKGTKIVLRDSQSTPTQAVTAAKELIQVEKVKVLICGCYSGTFFPVQSYAASKGVLVLNAGASSPQIRTVKGSVVSVLSLDDTVAHRLANWAYSVGHRKAAFVVGNDPYSVGVQENVGAAFEKLGGTIVETAIVQPGQPDYRPELTKVATAKPDVIFSTSFSNDAKLQFKQSIELGITATWFELYPTVSGLQGYKPAFGKVFGLEIGWLGSAAKAWRARYKKMFNAVPTVPWPALGYDATQLAGKAVDSSAKTAKAYAAALVKAARTYRGPSGSFQFDKNLTRVNETLQRLKLVAPGKFVPA